MVERVANRIAADIRNRIIEQEQYYFFENDFIIRGANKRIPKGSFLEMALDDKEITGPHNVRVVDRNHNIFLYLDINDHQFGQ